MELDAEFKQVKFETFSCGHKVRLVEAGDEIVMDLQALHGIEALNELQSAIEHERQIHLAGACKNPQDECTITSRPSDDGKTLRFFLQVNGKEVRELGEKS